MEPTRSQIANSSVVSTDGEVFRDEFLLKDKVVEWRDLSRFWTDEKPNVKDVNKQTTQLFGGLDKQAASSSDGEDEDIVDHDARDEGKVNGKNIGDIPTSYSIEGFKDQELIVIGTYVDKRIVPGFRYKVRKNITDKYLFDGKALHLESIGLGYGKRLTFESHSLNHNSNYLWSDSSEYGLGLSLQALNNGDVFNIVDSRVGNEIGRAIIRRCHGDQVEMGSILEKGGKIMKKIRVQFSCDVVLSDYSNKQNLFLPNTPVSGVAVVVRETFNSTAVVQKIQLDEFCIKGCELISEE